MRRAWTGCLVGIGALALVAGCSRPEATEARERAAAASNTPAEAPAEEPPAAEEPAAEAPPEPEPEPEPEPAPVMAGGDAVLTGPKPAWIGAVPGEVEVTDFGLNDEQLQAMGARKAFMYRIASPALRILVLEYATPEEATRAISGVSTVVNRSGLIHHAEATGRHGTVFVVGTEHADEPDEEARAVIDAAMVAYMKAGR